MNQERADIIHSWPAIAAVLGVSESTVRRWHKQRPMPLKQVGEGCLVMIRESDLWAWFNSRGSTEEVNK
jgi:predicted DNA-binding transcriptional regulator AlpA